jgi:hypothetical protein
MKRTAEQQLTEQQSQALAKKQLTLEQLSQVTGGFALEMLGTRAYGLKTKTSETECLESD